MTTLRCVERRRRRCCGGQRSLDHDLDSSSRRRRTLDRERRGDWTMVDETTPSRAQTAALSVRSASASRALPPKAQARSIAWRPVGAGDCHDIALQPSA